MPSAAIALGVVFILAGASSSIGQELQRMPKENSEGMPSHGERLLQLDQVEIDPAGIGPQIARLSVIPSVPSKPLGDISGLAEQSTNTESVMDFVSPISSIDATIELYVGQSRTITMKKPISEGKSVGVVAVGDPTIADFEILPNPRMLRLSGRRAGLTDLTIILGDDSSLTLQVLVKYDVDLLRAEIRQRFPDTNVKISQLRENLVLEGQVRSGAIASQIVGIAESWLYRGISSSGGASSASGGRVMERMEAIEDQAMADPNANPASKPQDFAGLEVGARAPANSQSPSGKIINLLSVPGTQQIMLQVRVAELNRTGLREIGADWLFASGKGSVIGTNIAGNTVVGKGSAASGGLGSAGSGNELGLNSTAFGIFPSANFDVLLRVLRKNSLLSILAEPNLVAMSGHEASFLAGGQFPVPVISGLGGQISIQFKDFGVQLRFTPTIIDEDTIRLNVAPEVSTIDEALGTTLVPGGIPTPGINTRKVNTTVEMNEGETLALAGLLEIAMDAQTTRIPGLGDLPYLGPFFSNTSQQRVEKELLVLVTPFIVAASPNCEEFPLPGEEVVEPNDLEFYLLGRIEGKTGRSFNTVHSWEDPWNCVERMKLERQCLHGPVGFSR